MAEEFIVVGAVEVIKKLSCVAAQEIYLVWGVKGEMKKLQKTLSMIQAVLEDAEKRQVKDKAVRLWLKMLKDVAFDADNILDEFSYEVIRCKLEIKNKVCNFFSSSNPLVFLFKMAHKIKNISQKLDEIARDKERFQLLLGTTHIVNENGQSRESYSLVDDTEIVGREHDKSKLIDILTDSDNQEILSIIPIVGMGGLGKTTLAQFVYNDTRIEKHFDLRIWVCVSEDFDAKLILREIIESARGDKHGAMSSMDLITRKVREELSGKKFLLVLDDVWNKSHEKWDGLKVPLRGGIKGSKIIVTTRSDEVASIMGTLPTHYLQNLSEDECWFIFKQRAFGIGGAEETPNLVAIGKEIVKKCGGVPLAAKSLGGLMRLKKEEHEWFSILNNEVWDLPEDKSGIMPALRLSYDHLPSHLKQCFSYCSIFPKDFVIKKKVLIQLWMAGGFLQPKTGTALMEDVGHEYFNILLWNSFFQDEKRDSWGEVMDCKIHDLAHDLAQFVSRFECSTMDAERVENIYEIRHLTVCFNKEISVFPEALRHGKKLHTFSAYGRLDSSIKNFSRAFYFKCLRILDLSRTKIKDLPDSIIKLKHLRYLDLSLTVIEALPMCITRLYHLQTLRLRCCHQLKELPSDMKKLINLRHFEIDDWAQWNEMPKEMGQLSSLLTLPLFKVGIKDEQGIQELKCLNLLRGELEISNLENVKDTIDAESAGLKWKENLLQLKLAWTDGDHGGLNDDDVLEGLQPHSNLKGLEISNFLGVKFPTWMSSTLLANLVEIKLDHCTKSEHIPALGQFPYLKVLTLCGMDSVKCLGVEFYKGGANRVFNTFSSLKELNLESLPNLEEWAEEDVYFSSFPRLEKLSIEGCPKLTLTPTLFPCLWKLEVDESNSMALLSVTSKLTSLTTLEITYIPELLHFPQGLLQNNKLLQHLEIANCPNLKVFPYKELSCLTNLEHLRIGCFSEDLNYFPIVDEEDNSIQQHLPSLKKLEIRGLSRLTSLPDQLQYLTTLRELKIADFCNLVALPEWLGDFLSLEILKIEHCENLIHFPSKEAMQGLKALQLLHISGCSHLKKRCTRDSGGEWSKISHIPRISFTLR